MSDKAHELTEKLKSDLADFQDGCINQREYEQRRQKVIRQLKAHNKQRYGFAAKELRSTNKGECYAK